MISYNLRDFLSRSTDTPLDETTLHKVLQGLPQMTAEGPWVAGGALRRMISGQEPESDFDFFFRNPDQMKDFESDLVGRGLNKIRETEHHVHYKGRVGESSVERNVQCIRFKYYEDAPAVIDSFDFTICQFAYDGSKLIVGDHSLWDLGRKRLAIHRITYPVATMRRLLKYGRQGFVACNGCLQSILTRTAESPELLSQLNIFYVD